MKFNINDNVKFTLTKFGAKVFNARYDGLNLPSKYAPAPKAPGAEVTEQLWAVMQTFGPHISLGGDVPFEKCNMELMNGESVTPAQELQRRYDIACEALRAIALSYPETEEGAALAAIAREALK